MCSDVRSNLKIAGIVGVYGAICTFLTLVSAGAPFLTILGGTMLVGIGCAIGGFVAVCLIEQMSVVLYLLGARFRDARARRRASKPYVDDITRL